MLAEKVQLRAAKAGFDWETIGDVFPKVEEELQEVREVLEQGDTAGIREELGDLLFSVVNLCRFVDIEPEDALRGAVRKFTARYDALCKRIVESGRQVRDCSLEELDAQWNAVKENDN